MSQTEEEITKMIQFLRNIKINYKQTIKINLHIKYVNFTLHHLGQYIAHFQTSQPWVHYYIIHVVRILGQQLQTQDELKMTKALSFCFSEGFGGGYMQLPHLAPTYAAFLAILQLGQQAYHLLDRKKLYQFFKKCKKGNKIMMHYRGQCDLRAIFIVVLITKSLKLPQDILQGVAEIIIQSQTHQGGISNIIGGEAHGGFTFCGVAALALLNRLQDLDISRLLEWLSQRQTQFGGFNGRTNKLIDSCYSFWVGSIFNIINNYFGGTLSYQNHFLYSQQDLQKYIIFYCQDLQKGGLWDKPGKNRDIYHTCYALSGLSASQQLGTNVNSVKLQQIQPIYNITISSYQKAKSYFATLQPL